MISKTVGTDFMPAAATDSDGHVWVTWVGARGDHFHVFTSHQQDGGFSQPQRVSHFEGNEWEPAIAADAKGNLAVAWDTFDKGDYDVYVATRGEDGKLSEPQAVAASLAFEVRPSLAYDREGRLWIAYESSGDQWGKDFGALKKKGIPLYQTGRSLAVKVRDADGDWFAPDDVMDAMPGARAGGRRVVPVRLSERQPARQPNRTPITSIAPTYPRLACDGQGNMWLAFRGKPGGNWRVGVGTVWCEYLTRLGSDGWSDAVWIPHTQQHSRQPPGARAARRRPACWPSFPATVAAKSIRSTWTTCTCPAAATMPMSVRQTRRSKRELPARKPQSESDRSEQQHHVQSDRRT